MKILLILHALFEQDSGVAGTVANLGQQYQALGHEVYYYSFSHLPNWLSPKIRTVLFPEFVALQIWRLNTIHSLDVIDASTGDAWIWGKLLPLFGKQRPLLVTRSHGLEHMNHQMYLEDAQAERLTLGWKYPLYNGGFRLWEVASSLQSADLVFMLNHPDAAYTVKHLQVPTERIQVSPNGVADYLLNLPFVPTPLDQNTRIRIAQVGTYIPRKGIQYSVPALNTILQRYSNVEVSFLGTQTGQDGTVEEIHANFDPNVRNRVNVVPSFANAKLPELLNEHHILLFPSITEGFGKALVEGMACGLAPITTPAAGPMEVIREGWDAVLVPFRDATAIEQALERLICDRPFLHQLRCHAYETAQRYSWASIAQSRLLAYEQALQKLPRQHGA
jgi:glycosyltransferase involved in cell wall biosynthesis